MINFKSVARRGTSLAAAAAMLASTGTALLPVLAHADPLNPLTERTLLLSSSSPGFHYTDGSGNSTYAPPGSGPNGQKTGETFSFKVSTDSSASGTNAPIKAFTFQYCTTAAGNCIAPGDDVVSAGVDATLGTVDDVRAADDAGHTDLNANYSSAVEGTDFEVYQNGTLHTASGGDTWTLAVSNQESSPSTWLYTGKNNFITLANAGSTMQPTTATPIKIVFKASSTNYITNPGSGSFFVKINDYDSETTSDHVPTTTTHIIDGGVTVANVMTDSIFIKTKVLETMSFSVGTTNPDDVAAPGGEHGSCDAIAVNSPISLGDPDGEYSLSPQRAFDAYSYWRLASNSSGGATVYYSGTTLSNTVGDQIDDAGTTDALSHPGKEQFGLALSTAADGTEGAASANTGVGTPGTSSDFTTNIATDAADSTIDALNKRQLFHLSPLVAGSNYDEGAGDINGGSIAAKVAFTSASSTVPVPVANETTDVLHCATGKMRYVANIAPDTPAGVYTTKINYLAAPQY